MASRVRMSVHRICVCSIYLTPRNFRSLSASALSFGDEGAPTAFIFVRAAFMSPAAKSASAIFKLKVLTLSSISFLGRFDFATFSMARSASPIIFVISRVFGQDIEQYFYGSAIGPPILDGFEIVGGIHCTSEGRVEL